MESVYGTYHQYHNYDVSELEACENLNNAVVEQAVRDMADAVLKLEMARRQESAHSRVFMELDRFFKGKRIGELTNVDPKILRDAAVLQGNYMIWRHDKGCRNCTYAKRGKCVHGVKGALNWYDWSHGNHTCYRQLRGNKKPDVESLPDVVKEAE